MDEETRNKLSNLKLRISRDSVGRLSVVVDDWMMYEMAVVATVPDISDLPDEYLEYFFYELIDRWDKGRSG